MKADPWHHEPANAALASQTSVGHQFLTTARQFPLALAMTNGNKSVTYGKLDQRVNRLSQLLLKAGIRPQQRVAIVARNSFAFVEVLLAAARVGAIACCQNWRLTVPELTHCLQLVSPTFVFCDAEFSDLVDDACDAETAKIVFGQDYERRLKSASERDVSPTATPAHGLLVLYTSGTTGYPKGALITHRASLYRAFVYAAELNVPADDTFFAWSPLFHIGSADQTLATLMRGGKVFVVDGFDAEVIAGGLEAYRTQWFSVLPGMADKLIDCMNSLQPRIRGVGTVGGMPDLIRREQIAELSTLFNAPYLDSFGSTETGIAPGTGSLIPIGQVPERLLKRQTVGCEVRLVDASDQDVPDGTPGEIVFRGPTLFSGYVGDDEANNESFRGGWYHMGDVFRRCPDTGLLEFVDRLKYLIKSGGENIYPAEIENVLLADPRIEDVTVVRRRDPKWGEVPVAFVARASEDLSAGDVLAMCDGVLARYKLPKEIRFIRSDEFPRGSTGKVQRNLLEDRLTTD
jgi:fatty-acyl-CoA synthase